MLKLAARLSFSALLLSGCASTAERDASECGALGDRPGSAVYEDCMRYAQGIRSVQTQQRQAKAWANVDRTSQALLIQGAAEEQRNRVIHCTSTPFGRQVNTTCY